MNKRNVPSAELVKIIVSEKPYFLIHITYTRGWRHSLSIKVIRMDMTRMFLEWLLVHIYRYYLKCGTEMTNYETICDKTECRRSFRISVFQKWRKMDVLRLNDH